MKLSSIHHQKKLLPSSIPVLRWTPERKLSVLTKQLVPMSGYVLASTNLKLLHWKHSRSEVSRF